MTQFKTTQEERDCERRYVNQARLRIQLALIDDADLAARLEERCEISENLLRQAIGNE